MGHVDPDPLVSVWQQQEPDDWVWVDIYLEHFMSQQVKLDSVESA